jgi:hypothetical protein
MEDPFDPDYQPYTKKRHSVLTVSPLSTTIGQVLVGSQKRVAIVLSPHTNGEIQYSPGGVNTGHQSINMPSQSSPLILDEAIVGDIVKRPWFALLTAGAASQIGVIEVMTD